MNVEHKQISLLKVIFWWQWREKINSIGVFEVKVGTEDNMKYDQELK